MFSLLALFLAQVGSPATAAQIHAITYPNADGGRFGSSVMLTASGAAQLQMTPDAGAFNIYVDAGNAVEHTSSDVALYVNPLLGTDTLMCTAPGVLACKTIQAAINKVPKYPQHGVDITLASAADGGIAIYDAGFAFSGFTFDEGVQQTSIGITIHGGLALSVLATGTASGTATSGTEGTYYSASPAGTTFGTLLDLTQNWTVNDLRGRFLIRLGGTGGLGTDYIWTISSNTATQITVVGAQTPVDATSTYQIVDPTAKITGDLPIGISGGGFFQHGAVASFTQNQGRDLGAVITLKNLTISPNTAQGFAPIYVDNCNVAFTNVQVAEPFASAAMIYLRHTASATFFSSSLNCGPAGGAPHDRGVIGGGDDADNTSLTLQGSSLRNCSEAIWKVRTLAQFNGSEITGSDRPIQLLPFSDIPRGSIQGSRIDGSAACSASWAAVDTSLRSSGFGGESKSVFYVDSLNVSSCAYGVSAYGGTVSVESLSGAITGVGVIALGGGTAYVTRTGYTATAPTEVRLDNDVDMSRTLLEVGAGDGGPGCFAGLSSGSRVCAR